MQCEWCEEGLQHLCPNVRLTIVGGHQGGFATHVRVENWQFAFPLPDEIASEHAGPLMCAGATVFTPILQYGVRPRRSNVAHGHRLDDRGASGPAGWASLGAAGTIAARRFGSCHHPRVLGA